ncbi:MAG: acetylxylan esterase [Armatimonadota bacterium]
MRMRLLALCWLVILAVAGAFAAEGVTLTKADDGSFIATTPNYTAKVGADGNLHSLVSGGTEFLCDNVKNVVGGGYLNVKEGAEWTAEVYKFEKTEQTAPDTVTATADKHTLTYQFLPDAIELKFGQLVEPTIWTFAINPTITDIRDFQSGESYVPNTWRECMPHLFSPTGANVLLPAGALYFIGKNSRVKSLATEPHLDQIWMPRSWGKETYTKRIVVHAKPTVSDALSAQLAVAKTNHLFPAGAPAEVGLAVKMRFPDLVVDAQAELVVTEFLEKKEVFRKSQPLKLAAMSDGKVIFPVTPPPGFYEAVLTVKQGDTVLAVRQFPLAYDIDHITPPERPADFDKFWDDTLAEQEKIPANMQLTLHKDEAAYKLYKMRFDGLMGRQFHAWLSVPKAPGKYPAHVNMPPSGIHPPYLPYSGPGVVGMSLAIAGQEVEAPAGGYKYAEMINKGDYFRAGIETRETWYYRVVFAACSRAIDLLAAMPEVDGNKIFVTGGSQGGGLSFITAALNPKVTMAACGSPGLFGLEWKLKKYPPNYWPALEPIDENRQPITDPKAIEARSAVVRYGDAANFAPRIKGIVLLGVGFQDHVTSPVGLLASWSRLKNARIRAILIDPWAGHNGPRGGQALFSSWFGTLANGKAEDVCNLTQAGVLPVIIEKK